MADSKLFSIPEALKFGWETTKKNFWFLAAIILIPQVISWLVSFSTGSLYTQSDSFSRFLGFVITIAGWVIGLEISFAQIVIFLKFIDKKKPQIAELFSYFETATLARFFIITLLYGVMVALGLVLFIIPGIYLGIKYFFAVYIYVDKKTGIMESFKKSGKITQGAKWQLFGFGLLSLLIIAGGALVFLVGLLVAIPVVYLAQIHVYRKLSVSKH